MMKPFPLPILLLIVSLLCSAPAFADYNPATGEDDLILISEAQEVKMGNSLAKSVEKKFGLTRDSAIQDRVDGIGQKIAAVCDRSDLTYSFRVIEGEELEKDQRFNAFALPGGYVYIFKDMVGLMESDDELAAILAHEVGHIVARHSVKKLQGAIGTAGLQLLGAISHKDKRTYVKSSIAITHLMMAYSRQAEFEADKLSVRYLRQAGFDPKASVNFMDRMLNRKLKGKVYHYHYFRTHPYTSERKAMLNREIEGEYGFDDYINVTDEEGEVYW